MLAWYTGQSTRKKEGRRYLVQSETAVLDTGVPQDDVHDEQDTHHKQPTVLVLLDGSCVIVGRSCASNESRVNSGGNHVDLVEDRRATKWPYERQTDMIGTLEGGEDEFVDCRHKDQEEEPNDKPIHVTPTNK